MLVKKGSFNAPTSTGNSAVTGVGFTPKALILWGSAANTAGFIDTMSFGMGFSTGTSNRKAMAAASDDSAGVANSNSGARYADLAITILSSGTPTVGAEADFVSFGADGFTLNWTTAAAGKDYVIHYIAIGGAGVTNAKASVFTASASTGAQAVTGVGFQPDCVLLMGTESTALGNKGPGAEASFALGMAVSSSQRGTSALGERDAQATTNVGVRQSAAQVLYGLVAGAGTATAGDFTSMDADGFTVNWSIAAAQEVVYLALKGGSYFVGSDSQKTSTGTQAKTGVGFTPKAVLFSSFNRTTSATADSTFLLYSVGATDGTASGGVWVGSVDNVGTPNTQSASYATVLQMNAVGSTTNAEAAFSAFGADGYTLNWTTADATAREIIFLAMGGAEPAATTTSGTSILAAAHRRPPNSPLVALAPGAHSPIPAHTI